MPDELQLTRSSDAKDMRLRDHTAILDAARRLHELMSPCRLCPRRCGAERLAGKRGVCGAGATVELAAATAHFGEEPPINGERGSGTLFFSHCTLKCLYCQNWPISQQGVGRPLTVDALAGQMMALQRRGVHNINLVNPTHYWPPIAEAVYLARRRGLTIPVLANSSGFENVETLRLLDPVVQIWLPDVKYVSPALAARYSGSRALPEAAWRTALHLLRTYGPLRLDEHGVATGGVLIRHLVLPGGLGETRAVLRRLRRCFGRRLAVSLMTQYFPAYKAPEHSLLRRALTDREKQRAWRLARRFRITRGWRQQDG